MLAELDRGKAEAETADAVIATFDMGKHYYVEAYSVWCSKVSRYRKYQLLLAAMAGICGITVWVVTNAFVLTGSVLLAIAVFETAGYYRARHRWFLSCIKARIDPVGSRCRLRMTEQGIHLRGMTSERTVFWNDIPDISENARGLLLRGAGFQLYVPKSALMPLDGVLAIRRWHAEWSGLKSQPDQPDVIG